MLEQLQRTVGDADSEGQRCRQQLMASEQKAVLDKMRISELERNRSDLEEAVSVSILAGAVVAVHSMTAPYIIVVVRCSTHSLRVCVA